MPKITYISKESYLTKVESLVNSSVNSIIHLESLSDILGYESERVNLYKLTNTFLFDVSKGIEGYVKIVPLNNIHQLLVSKFNCYNWHYDRKAQCLLVNLRRGRHERLCGVLHQLYVNSDSILESAAEKFIDEGIGWFKSTVSLNQVEISKDIKLTNEEKLAFSSVIDSM